MVFKLLFLLILLCHFHDSSGKCFKSHIKRRQKTLNSLRFNEDRWNRIEKIEKDIFSMVKKSQPFRDYMDVEYISTVNLGTPPQAFDVILDTGSADFWLPSSECEENPWKCQRYCRDPGFAKEFCHRGCAPDDDGELPESVNTCDGKHIYRSDQSSTYSPRTEWFAIVYGTGDARGQLGTDDLIFGEPNTDNSLKVPGVTFGRAFEIADFFNDTATDGILGLAFQDLSVTNSEPAFITAVRKGLTKPIFTVYMDFKGSDSDGEIGGQITYGELDEDNCHNDELFYVKLSRALYWQFTVQGGSVKGENDSGPRRIPLKYEVISDTGTSFVTVPKKVFQIVSEAIDGVVKTDGGGSKRLFVACNAKFEITFNVYENGRERSIVLTDKHLVLTGSDGDGDCGVAMGYTNSNLGILGEPLMRAYCNVHDVDYKRIGFARTKTKA